MVKVLEIFYGIQGEGIHQGVPMVFIRLAGCNLLTKCSYCDTSYAWNSESGRDMPIGEITGEVSKLSPHYRSWICITGGEPLWQEEGLEELVRELKRAGYLVTIETNSSFKPPRWYTLVDSWNADIKCPSSGVCGVSREVWFTTRQQDQIKFVVKDREDLDFAEDVLERHRVDSPTILVSPVVDKCSDSGKLLLSPEWLQEVAEFCKKEKVRLSLQLHKVIWGNQRGV